nr:EamA-like transporter family protein [Acidobacteriota bacterium]
MTSHQKIPAVIGIPLAVLAGLVIPVQGRINAALGTRLHDGMAAAVVSFTTGLVVMAVISLVFPRGRQGFKAMGTSLKNRAFPRWFVLAGMVGGLFVLAQGVTVTLIGIALFTVAAV